MRLRNDTFRYVPSGETDVMATWMRFGYRPMSRDERLQRLRASPGARAVRRDRPDSGVTGAHLPTER
jgi:hypothetical protein